MLWCGCCPVHWARQAAGCWQLRVQVHVMGVLITVLCGCATIRWLGCCWSLACLVDRSLRFHASEMCPVRCPAEYVLLSGVATESFPYVFGAVCIRPYSVYSKAFSGRCAPQLIAECNLQSGCVWQRANVGKRESQCDVALSLWLVRGAALLHAPPVTKTCIMHGSPMISS